MYTEMLFPAHDIRFIAINNGVDSINGTENDMTPFINIFNEFYAKDTSRKIKAVFKAKGNAGKSLCTNPPYGERLLEKQEAGELIRSFGKAVRACPGWKAYILSSHESFESCWGKRADKRRRLYNGMIPCQLFMYFSEKKRQD